MNPSSLEFLRCVRCGGRLELDAFASGKEVEEGILLCGKCGMEFPIIEQIPILWDDFSAYLASKRILGGKLYRLVQSTKLRSFVKRSLGGKGDDRSNVEERWARIYQNSRRSRFYSVMRKHLDSLPPSKLALEHGCSIGMMTRHLANSCEQVFGVDRSFSAIRIAKKKPRHNLDYFVADSLSPVFGRLQFDLVLALNVLEIIEPKVLLKTMSQQITKGYLVISDPYDFERGPRSVKNSLDASSLRASLKDLGFGISKPTKNPLFIPWNLKLNPRAILNYQTDLVISRKS